MYTKGYQQVLISEYISWYVYPGLSASVNIGIYQLICTPKSISKCYYQKISADMSTQGYQLVLISEDISWYVNPRVSSSGTIWRYQLLLYYQPMLYLKIVISAEVSLLRLILEITSAWLSLLIQGRFLPISASVPLLYNIDG